ncbi:MAG: hypothetical protein U9O82_05915 [Thermodesulfobacteriota bacterium]|nr:hypothetical protein [Thermodesulfobacteriota bacterium]
MKKKAQSPEAILARAEKMFAKRNFQAAIKEYERANRSLQQDGIIAKIQICKKEIAGLNAKELIKKARRHLKKNNQAEAIRCFEKAYQITGEMWLQEKIGQLQEELQCRDSVKDAITAETKGDYLTAAELYGRIEASEKGREMRCKKAHCLVMAEKWEEAVPSYEGFPLSAPRDIYNFGLALAMQSRYHDCLQTWEGLDSEHPDFAAQKEIVISLWISDLYNRLRNDYDSAGLYEEARLLLHFTDHPDLKRLMEYCRAGFIKRLWREERYETIIKLFHNVTETDVDLLELRAKAGFRLMEESENHPSRRMVDDFIMYWLTALYHPGILERFPVVREERDILRQKLIERAEKLVKKYAGSGGPEAENALKQWRTERRVIEDLYELSADQQQGPPVCTARFAVYFDQSARMAELIRANRDFFRDTEHYLTTGSYFSSAAKGLLNVENKKYEQALKGLNGITGRDEFTEFAVLRIQFEYGLHCLHSGNVKDAVKYLTLATPLFDKASGPEKELTGNAFDIYEASSLQHYEEVLKAVRKKRQSTEINKALSTIMTGRAIDLHNNNSINIKALSVSLRKALTLYPENEMARIAMRDVDCDLEIIKLRQAISRRKMNKACRIVLDSEYEEPYNEFFNFMKYNIEALSDDSGMEKLEKISILNDMYNWCFTVDSDHVILDDLSEELDRLDQR